jgi:hypothetical protein
LFSIRGRDTLCLSAQGHWHDARIARHGERDATFDRVGSKGAADHRMRNMPIRTPLAPRRLVSITWGLIIASLAPAAAYAQIQSPSSTTWAVQNIGNPAPNGWAAIDNDRFTIAASVTGISAQTDQFRFVYQILSGDVQIVARLDSLAPADRLSKAGLMIRSSLQPDASQGSLLMSGDGTLTLHSRKESGGLATSLSRHRTAGAPQWLGLQRAGTRVVAYSSSDGETWTVIGTDSIEFGAVVYVGIAVSSQDVGQTTIAETSQMTFIGLPAEQQHRDIGAVPIPGSAWYTQGTYTVTGSGAALSDAQDQFHLVYQAMRGDVDVSARVASLTDVSPGAKAGVMIRESLGPASRYASALITAGHEYAFDRRVEAGWPSDRTDGGSGAAPGWVRLVRRGTHVEAFRSGDGSTWTLMESTEIAMGEEIYVGLAVTSQDSTIEATANLDNVRIASILEDAGLAPTLDKAGVESLALPNLPPAVTLLTPANGATFAAPATVTMSAAAVDPEERLSRVEFHANGTLIGTATTSPYRWTWSSVPAGSYTLTAVAADADGGTTTSSAVAITVTAPNQAPTVTLTSPATGATFTAPATIALTASASDPENRLGRVDFYNGSTLLATDTASPFSFTWSSVPAGSYTLTAVATDADGGSATSTAGSITVNTPPSSTSSTRVIFTASADHDAMVTNYLLEVFTIGTDPNTGSAIASADIGKPAPDANGDITIDETSFFDALSPGRYTVTVAAVWDDGTTRSDPITYTR